MPDYSKSSNNTNEKEPDKETPDKPPKQVEKVVVGEVVLKKKGIGRKFKDLIVGKDLKGIGKHVFLTVVLPWSKKMAYDAWVESGNRVIFPDAPKRPILDARGIQRSIIDYGGMSRPVSPISRASTIPLRDPRSAPAREIGPRASSVIQNVRPGEQYLFTYRDDAMKVLEVLREALAKYEEPISLGDLYEAMGMPSSHVDQKWGWTSLANVKLLQSSQGYVLDFPPAEAIQQ